MSELSVNISQSERSRIQDKAIQLIYRTASAKDYDANFRKSITTDIVNEGLEKFRVHLNMPVAPYLHYVKNYEYGKAINILRLPNDIRIFELAEPEIHVSTDRTLLRRFNVLESLQFDDFSIDPQFTKGDRTLFPFVHFNDRVLTISDKILDKIEMHNVHMAEEFEGLGIQLNTLLKTIARCKTTKAFCSVLPNLTSLFPISVQRKIHLKNKKEPEELTDVQQALVDATSSIATANLIGE